MLSKPLNIFKKVYQISSQSLRVVKGKGNVKVKVCIQYRAAYDDERDQ